MTAIINFQGERNKNVILFIHTWPSMFYIKAVMFWVVFLSPKTKQLYCLSLPASHMNTHNQSIPINDSLTALIRKQMICWTLICGCLRGNKYIGHTIKHTCGTVMVLGRDIWKSLLSLTTKRVIFSGPESSKLVILFFLKLSENKKLWHRPGSMILWQFGSAPRLVCIA